MITEGEHKATPTNAILSETKNGREYVAVKLSTDEGPIVWFGYFGDKVDAGGKTLTERTVDALRLCGWRGDDLMDLSSINASHEVLITVVHEEYQGKVQAKVRYINDPNGSIKPMDTGKARSFAQRMKTKIANASTPSREPGEDDDIL